MRRSMAARRTRTAAVKEQHGENENGRREKEHESGGGSFNCSNAFAETEFQCFSNNELIQTNESGNGPGPPCLAICTNGIRPGDPGGSGDQRNNANQNNQPGGGTGTVSRATTERFAERRGRV